MINSVKNFIEYIKKMETSSADLKRLLQTLIVHAKDPSFTVANASKQSLALLAKEKPEVYLSAKTLSSSQYEQYMGIMQEMGVEIKNSLEIKSLIPAHQTPIKVSSFIETVSKSNYPVSSDGLVYGIITNDQLDLINHSDWKQRIKGIEELEAAVGQNGSNLLPFVSSFVRFLIKLLNDPNFKIVYSTMQILGKILKLEQLNQKMDLGILLNGLVERLGDNKIAIRQASYTLLRSLYKIMKGKEFLTQIAEFLCSPNWHIRECLLNLITIVFLEERLSGFNKEMLIGEIIKLLEDSKPKVSLASFETLAVICIKCGIEVINDFVNEQLNKATHEKLCDRVETGALPMINEDGMIEYNTPASVVEV